MKHTLGIAVFLLVAVIGCSSKESSSNAREKIDNKWGDRIGKATKSDLVEDFGNAEWCRPSDSGTETCRFYRKKGTKWMGEVKDRKSFEQFDEVMAEFDQNGVLRSYKSNAQR